MLREWKPPRRFVVERRGGDASEPRFRVTLKKLSRETGFTREAVKVACKRAGLCPVPPVIGLRQLRAILQQCYLSAAQPHHPVHLWLVDKRGGSLTV